MEHNNFSLEAPFQVVGAALRTSHGTAQADLPGHYQQTLSSGCLNQIEANSGPKEMIMVYTNYESDYSGAYDAVLGHRSQSNPAPEQLAEADILAGDYVRFKVPSLSALAEAWNYIHTQWPQRDRRRYDADYEIHRGLDQPVEIYVGIV